MTPEERERKKEELQAKMLTGKVTKEELRQLKNIEKEEMEEVLRLSQAESGETPQAQETPKTQEQLLQEKEEEMIR